MLAPFIPPAFRNDHGFAEWKSGAIESPVVDRTPELEPEPVAAAPMSPSADAHADIETALPWIEAFVADEAVHVERDSASAVESPSDSIEPEHNASDARAEVSDDENWMLGEAAKRLNELTEGLTSLDASRTEHAETFDEVNANAASQEPEAAAPAPLPMWGDDEWMDIMPTSRIAASLHEQPVQREAAALLHPYRDDEHQQAMEAAATEAIEAQLRHAEAAAQALEAVARRVRAGDFAIPDIEPELGEAAMLAGVLASLLRTGR